MTKKCSNFFLFFANIFFVLKLPETYAKKIFPSALFERGGLQIVNQKKPHTRQGFQSPNPVSGPFYRSLKVRKNRIFGQDEVRKSQNFGFRNLRTNPVYIMQIYIGRMLNYLKYNIFKYNIYDIIQTHFLKYKTGIIIN